MNTSSSSGGVASGSGVESVAWETTVDVVRLCMATLASFLGANLCARALGVPKVLSYIVLGALLGPQALALVGPASPAHLWFVKDTALIFIGFVAGCELVLKEIDKPKALALACVKGILSCLLVVSPLVFAAGKLRMPWLRDLGTNELIATSLVLAIIAAARAPSVTIACIRELRARGPFTKAVVPAVVTLSIVVLLLFAVNNAICDGILRGKFEVTDLANVLVLLALSAAVASLMALLMALLFAVRNVLPRFRRIRRSTRVTIRTTLRVGGLAATALVPVLLNKLLVALRPQAHGIKVELDLLTTGMFAGLVVVNWTKCRVQFTHSLNACTPYIFAIFFTLTGVSLNIAILATTWSLVPFFFFLRVLALFAGHFLTWRSRFSWKHRALLWMGHVAQGGLSVSLIEQVPYVLPAIGTQVAAVSMGVLVLNTIAGPAAMKIAIKLLHEDGKLAPMQTMIIVGCDTRSMLFASKIIRSGWAVVLIETSEAALADARKAHADIFDGFPPAKLKWLVLPRINAQELRGVGVRPTDNLVCALPTDNDNYELAKAAVELGLSRVLVRLHDPANSSRFFELNVLVLDMTSALLDFADMARSQALAPLLNMPLLAPQPVPQVSETSRLLANAPRELRTVKVVDPLEDHFGKALKDLVWNQSVFVSAVIRGSSMLVPTPTTVIIPGDKLVVVGSDAAVQSLLDGNGDEEMLVGDEAPIIRADGGDPIVDGGNGIHEVVEEAASVDVAAGGYEEDDEKAPLVE